MRLSELLKREVVTESGLSLGKVHDVRGELEDGRLRVTGLACGPGLLERFGVGTDGTGGPSQAKVHGHPAIPGSGLSASARRSSSATERVGTESGRRVTPSLAEWRHGDGADGEAGLRARGRCASGRARVPETRAEASS